MSNVLASFHTVLDRLPAEESTDLDDAIEIVSRKFADHRLRAETADLRLTVRTGTLDDLRMHRIGYGTPVTIEAAPLRDCYLICVPLAGRASVRLGGREQTCDPSSAMLLPPDCEFRLHWTDASPQLVLYIPRERLARTAAALTGSRLQQHALPLAVPLRSDAGGSFASALMSAHRDVNSGAIDGFPGFLTRNLADGLVARLLLAAERGDAESTSEDARRVPARTKLMDRFLDTIARTAAAELTPLSIAKIMGVPLRTLQESVQKGLDSSLAEVLRTQRLSIARTMLLEGDPSCISVTEVAMQCGFRHLGRFSVEYRERFGEKPSETLRLAR